MSDSQPGRARPVFVRKRQQQHQSKSSREISQAVQESAEVGNVFVDLYRELIGTYPDLPVDQAKRFINRAQRDVYDESTTDFMKTFYRHLRAGASKAGAVQMSMRELRERYPHPFFWAPFVLVGQ